MIPAGSKSKPPHNSMGWVFDIGESGDSFLGTRLSGITGNNAALTSTDDLQSFALVCVACF